MSFADDDSDYDADGPILLQAGVTPPHTHTHSPRSAFISNVPSRCGGHLVLYRAADVRSTDDGTACAG